MTRERNARELDLRVTEKALKKLIEGESRAEGEAFEGFMPPGQVAMVMSYRVVSIIAKPSKASKKARTLSLKELAELAVSERYARVQNRMGIGGPIDELSLNGIILKEYGSKALNLKISFETTRSPQVS